MLPSIFGENLFDEFFDGDFERAFFGRHNPLYGHHAKNLMKTDVKEVEGGYELDIDLPGFKKEEVAVDLQNGCLTVSAAKGLDKSDEEKDGRYIRRERCMGSCSRSFYVGDVRMEEVKCKFDSGVLKVRIPRHDAPALGGGSRIAIE